MIRNLQYNRFGTIDLEYNHPNFGWIPFTANPDDIEPIGLELYNLALSGEYGAIAPYVPVVIIPQEVSRAQALIALNNAGLLSNAQAIIDDPATDLNVKIAWDNAQTFNRSSPTLAALAAQLGLSDTDLDNLFIAAGEVII